MDDKESMNNKMNKGTKASMSINTKTSKRSFSAYDASTDHAAVEVKHKQSYVSWNKEMDSNLAFILTEQMALGHKCDGDTWKPQALHAVVTLKSWKKHFNVVSDIQTNQSGFAWDEDRKMIVVTSDESSSWAAYVESHPDAKGMQNKMIGNWDDIVLLCGRARARTSSSTDSNLEKKTKFKKDSLAEVVGVIATSFQEYLARKKQEEKPNGIEIHEVVSVIPGLTCEEVFKAVRKLMNSDLEEFKLLKALPEEKKQEWIYYLINS
ncbi:myeloid differentiation primary response protein MyD88, partial [Striga asiatica]